MPPRDRLANTAMYTGALGNGGYKHGCSSPRTRLYALASDTGGQGSARLQRPHAGHSFRRSKISPAITFSGYYNHEWSAGWAFPQDQNLYGRRKSQPNLDYRQGYYAGKTISPSSPLRIKTGNLKMRSCWGDPCDRTHHRHGDQLLSAKPARSIFVPIVVKIPGRELALAQEGGSANTHLIDFILEVKDDLSNQHYRPEICAIT